MSTQITDEQFEALEKNYPILSYATLPQDINASFVLTSGYLVFMMQAGFCLLTLGCVRAKSVRNVCLKNLMDACFGGIGFFLFGWAFAYGDNTSCDADGVCVNTGNGFIGTNWFAMSNTPANLFYSWFFQYVFAISTATIVAGAVAERMRFEGYALYAFFLTSWVYPVLAHWIWSGAGWAAPTRQASVGPLFLGNGAYDTVGSGAVHMLSGVAGLWGAVVLGPRIGRFDSEGKPINLCGHNSAFFITGVFLLWFGFYGFNPGTMYMITGFSDVVARCAISTTLGGVFGGVTGLFVSLLWYYVAERKIMWDLYAAGGSALAGMVVITSGCGMYMPWAAALGGILGGVVYFPTSWFMLHIFKVDDPCEVFTLHGVCGALGVFWQALLAHKSYVFEIYGEFTPTGEQRHWGWWQGSDALVLGANTVWILVIFGWTTAMMLPFFLILKVVGLLRVSEDEELAGLDVSKHGGLAYDHGDLDVSVKSKGIVDTSDRMTLLEARLAAMSEKLAMLEKGAEL